MSNRPKFLNLFILAPRMSITAKVSILHRITGALLCLVLPFLLYILHQSLIAPSFYLAMYQFGTSMVCKIIYTVLIAALSYHMCAGTRFLLLDLHIGVDKITAKYSAWIVIIMTIVITGLLGALIW